MIQKNIASGFLLRKTCYTTLMECRFPFSQSLLVYDYEIFNLVGELQYRLV